jgi:hypothetical protein
VSKYRLGERLELFASTGAFVKSYFKGYEKLTLGSASIMSSSPTSSLVVTTGAALGSTLAGALAGGAFPLVSLPAGADEAITGC